MVFSLLVLLRLGYGKAGLPSITHGVAKECYFVHHTEVHIPIWLCQRVVSNKTFWPNKVTGFTLGRFAWTSVSLIENQLGANAVCDHYVLWALSRLLGYSKLRGQAIPCSEWNEDLLLRTILIYVILKSITQSNIAYYPCYIITVYISPLWTLWTTYADLLIWPEDNMSPALLRNTGRARFLIQRTKARFDDESMTNELTVLLADNLILCLNKSVSGT